MCGRYRLSRRKQLLAEYFEIENEVEAATSWHWRKKAGSKYSAIGPLPNPVST